MCLELTKPPNYCIVLLYSIGLLSFKSFERICCAWSPTLNSIYNQAKIMREREREGLCPCDDPILNIWILLA